MILVFFIPSAIALVMIGILVHLVNYVSNNKLIFRYVTNLVITSEKNWLVLVDDSNYFWYRTVFRIH